MSGHEGTGHAAVPSGLRIPETAPFEDLFSFMQRTRGGFDARLYRQLLGAANAFKEGDRLVGVAAADEQSRQRARALLTNTRISLLVQHPVLRDDLHHLLLQSIARGAAAQVAPWTLGALHRFLLSADEASIAAILPGLTSETIAGVVKLMNNAELTAVSRKIFHPLPGSQLGARGYLGARLQPSSPTDNLDDIIWQVFSGWSYAVGDVLLGCNPVSASPQGVAAIAAALHDLRVTFGLQDTLPHCVLAPIDVQAAVEHSHPGSTGIWFQSLAGSAAANAPLGVTVAGMVRHARARSGRYGLYFETGQGVELSNGNSDGCDMVVHEARKVGFARALKLATAAARGVRPADVWLHVNDVAGFIGPQIFRSREQLVRCCLEDLVMGKLHGLMTGLDLCAARHMGISHHDFDFCLDQILPANPGYLVALPNRRDATLGHLSTTFQDHLRARRKFGYKVNDAMWRFFHAIGVIDSDGQPTARFGDPTWVYLHYRRRKGDLRTDAAIFAEGAQKIQEAAGRAVAIKPGPCSESRRWQKV